MSKKTISIILSIIMLLSILAACGGEEATTTTTTTADGDETTAPADDTDETTDPADDHDFAGMELSILVSQGWMDSYYDDIIASFEEVYSVTVDLQTIPANQYDDLLQARLTSGTATDIFWIQSNPFAIESVLVDPEAYAMDMTGSQWANVIPEERLPACMVGDTLYGLMLWHNSPEFVMVYNRSLFDELGIDSVPSTYAELLEISEIIAENDVIPWFIPGADGWQHQLAFFQIGPVYEEVQPGLYEGLNNNTETFANNEKMLEVLAQMEEFHELGYFGPDWIGTDSTNMANYFGDREIAMAMANSSYINQIYSETGSEDEFDIFLIPLGDNQNYPTNPAGPIMLGYRDTPNPELVQAFFNFVVTEESLQMLLDARDWTNLAVNEDYVSIEQDWMPVEEALMNSIDDDSRMMTPVLQTGTKYTNDYWMDFGTDMIAFFTGQIEANTVLERMDENRANSAALQNDPAWD